MKSEEDLCRPEIVVSRELVKMTTTPRGRAHAIASIVEFGPGRPRGRRLATFDSSPISLPRPLREQAEQRLALRTTPLDRPQHNLLVAPQPSKPTTHLVNHLATPPFSIFERHAPPRTMFAPFERLRLTPSMGSLHPNQTTPLPPLPPPIPRIHNLPIPRFNLNFFLYPTRSNHFQPN
ncbi:BQ5605_C002g01029 [Microbotryum silenes-dioicae]|uniref:BQ5605_C002g01029 protein n=1 Tax=Microbotryum silenes-dioicae TaxID=796604 RepID=A0A2X0P111_9BASI|nr:BQ5605_C002g01029 [Microbotryum silenes-dioicae]